MCAIKGATGKNILQSLFCFHDCIHRRKKLTLKDTATSHCFTLFIRGGPCHLSSFKQSSGDLIFLWERLDYSVMEKINISECALLRNIVIIKIWSLYFCSKSTYCPFKYRGFGFDLLAITCRYMEQNSRVTLISSLFFFFLTTADKLQRSVAPFAESAVTLLISSFPRRALLHPPAGLSFPL